MANCNGLKGFNRAQSTVNKILVAYGNDIIDLAAGTGYGLNLDSTKDVEFEVFLDRLFYQNYSERPKSFDGTSWTTTYVQRTPLAKYIRNYKERARLYIANCKFCNPQKPLDLASNDLVFPSRAFYSEQFIGNNLVWGIEWGTNGKTVLDTRIFELDQPLIQDFVAMGIKVGDPLFITSGNTQLAAKPYFVALVDSPHRLIVTEDFPATATSLHYWVGRNWLDVGTDDNDEIKGIGDNSGRLLFFKLMSLWYHTASSLKQVKDAVGTSSGRSILNYGGYTYYFHGSDPKISGIYRFDGVNSILVSRAIDPFIQGMDTDNYDNVIGWKEGNELRWYIGDLTNANHNISITKAVATLNAITNAWDVGPIADTPTCATTFRTSGKEDTYCGNSEGEVLKMSSGNNFNNDPIPCSLETKVYYPETTQVINNFTRLQVIGRQTKGVKVAYKLWDAPTSIKGQSGVDDEWRGLGELSNDKTELLVPVDHQFASGIQLRFYDMDELENDTYIEKATLFYKPLMMRI